MRRLLVLVAGCSFAPGAFPADGASGDDTAGDDSDSSCTSPARWPIDVGGAPAGYTITVDVTEALAVAPAGELHVFADAIELDRAVRGTSLDLRVPASGALSLVADAASTPLADPANVYLFAESFDALAVGDNGNARFDALPATEWAVADDASQPGNRVFHAAGGGRHPAAIKGLTLADGDIRARMRIGTGGTQQHNGLGARGNSMVPATMDGFVGQLMGDSNRTRIAEYTNGISPPIELSGVDGTISRNTWYALRLRYVGDVVELYVDDALALTATQGGWDGQAVGLFAHATDVDFDDVTVRMAVEPSPVATLGARETCP